MKRTILFILVSLMIIPSILAEDGFMQSEFLDIGVTYSNNINIIRNSPDARFTDIKVEYTFFPKPSDNQEIISIDSDGDIKNDSITFTWNDEGQDVLDLSVSSRVKTKNNFVRIKDKVEWPINELSSEYKIYTRPQEITNTNENIMLLASRLAEGEDDMFVVVNNIAQWIVNNVEYDLNTVTLSASKPSSWVLVNRKGVCDELTSLFISMLRSLGIPARFVVGTSYTNSDQFENSWGEHGWAEVYFPGYGWVPYDVTYQEFGYIDATHITNGRFLDTKPIQTNFEWRGNNVELKAQELKSNITILDWGPELPDFFDMQVNVLKAAVDFDSYNLIEAKITNLMDYYISTSIWIADTTKLELLDKNKKNILLRPKESKNYFWIVKVDPDLDKNYLYTFPIVVYTSHNNSAATKFQSIKDGKSVSLEYINEALKDKVEEQTKTYSKDLEITCESVKDAIFEEESTIITCFIENTGNIFLKDLKICLEEDCVINNLAITEIKKIDFKVPKKNVGVNELKVKASNEQVSKTETIEYIILDKPSINILDVEYPKQIRFDDQFKVIFTLQKDSESVPKDVKALVGIEDFKKELPIGDLNKTMRYEVVVSGSDLNAGFNEFIIKLEFKDDKEREYTKKEGYDIELVDLKFMDHIKILLRQLFKKWL